MAVLWAVRAATVGCLVAGELGRVAAFQGHPAAPLRRRGLARGRVTTSMVVEEKSTTEKAKATSFGPATLLRQMRADIPWLAEVPLRQTWESDKFVGSGRILRTTVVLLA